jgi:hypothetical protein
LIGPDHRHWASCQQPRTGGQEIMKWHLLIE